MKMMWLLLKFFFLPYFQCFSFEAVQNIYFPLSFSVHMVKHFASPSFRYTCSSLFFPFLSFGRLLFLGKEHAFFAKGIQLMICYSGANTEPCIVCTFTGMHSVQFVNF